MSLTIQKKLDEIYEDLSSNVTFIYQRDDLHFAIDLSYHSILQFYFQGKLLKRGWVEILAIGDTRCGKSETMERLINHYRAGEISSGENTSFAGLVGGLQQTQKRWSITWGRIPLNDKKLLCIDEVSGLSHTDIANMSQIRSSGIAEITKIQTERTFARTRLVWLSNPRADTPVSYYNNGVEIVKELIGKPEDIARYDLALVMSAAEVSKEVINQHQHKKIPHKFNTSVCHNLILWCWSRKPEQIYISEDTNKVILEIADMLCNKYSTDLPIVTMSEQKIKVARMTVALAARLFSTDETGEKVIVKPEHALYIGKYLDKIYSKPAFAYDIWSKTRQNAVSLANTEAVREKIAPLGKQVVDVFMDMKQIRISDLEEILGVSREETKDVLSFLIKNRALIKVYSWYQKQPAFIALLRDIQETLKEKTEVKEGEF
jgi:hypothetical protein